MMHFIAAKGVHGVLGDDIEAAMGEWVVQKLLVDLAPAK
jgi:hypothetical protein